MKKLIAIFAIFLFIVSAVFAFLQSGLAKKIAQNALAEALAESGFTVEIEKIGGTVPFALDLLGVKIKSDAIDISVDSLDTRLSLIGLLKKELLFTEVKARGISWQRKKPAEIGKGLPWTLDVEHFELTDVATLGKSANFKGSFKLGKRNKKIYLDATATLTDTAEGSGHIVLNVGKDGFLRLRGRLKTPALPIDLPLDSAADLRLYASGPWNGTIHGKISGTFTPKTSFLSPIKIKGNGQISGGRLSAAALQIQSAAMSANVAIKAEVEDRYRIEASAEDWQGQADAVWHRGANLSLPHFTFQAHSAAIMGRLELREKAWIGEIDLSIGNLNELPFGIYGNLQAKINGTEDAEGVQGLHLEGRAAGFYWKDLFCESLSFTSDLSNPFHRPRGYLQLAASEIKWRQLFFNALNFKTNSQDNNWLYSLAANGQWKHPLSFLLDGSWDYRSPKLQLSLQNASGSFYNHPLRLAAPASFEYSPDRFILSDLEIALADARLKLKIEREKENAAIDLSLSRFPLDILSLNPLEVPIGGRAECTLSLREIGPDLSGTLNAAISQLEVATPGQNPPLRAAGTFAGTFDRSRLELKGELDMGEKHLLQLDLSLPIDLAVWPPRAALIYDKKANGHLALNGRIEEILDFFDLGLHRIEGNCTCDLSLSNTLFAPRVEGVFRLDHGYYENYRTGMQLVDILAEGQAKGDQFHLDLTAMDRNRKGEFAASGVIELRPFDHFPFQFDTAFSRLEIVQIDLVSAEAQGKIRITGDWNGAVAKGQVEVIQSDLHVPDHIPRALPDLTVVYRNAVKPAAPPALSDSRSYPLSLDLEVKAPEGIAIEGRGLDSEWKGDFHVGGTYASIAAQGKLELIKGQFLFSGRSFKLIDGALTFRGLEREMPYLNLAASTQVKDVEITARLKGPLNNPQITLQSVPPLPLSTILAYLLFGQELAEINSFQALQLANSLAALAGEGPDVLETTRKALGVDRLQIVSVPSGNDELSDTIAIQVGKYVSEGVLVSLTQGAEDASSNISIEIEMKHGLVFQLESDQRQEQGKFTLKWTHSY